MFKKLTVLKGLFIGVGYGLGARAVLSLDTFLNAHGLMTFSFLFLVPFVIGLITAYYHDTVTKPGPIVRLILPGISMVGVVAISLFLGIEGIICALMGMPIFLGMAFLGACLGIKIFYRRPDTFKFSFILALPFIIAPIENYLGLTERIFVEETSILIHASEQTVWQNITRVKEITEDENHISLFQLLGFPRPIKAELDTIAVGGVRKAIFDRGLFFTETVTQVIPNRVLTFTIEADPQSIPPAALDEHVLVGDKYFDVMEGKYEMEKIGQDQICLHLTSTFRLSTSFNFYSGVWSKLIMRDIQTNILEVIKRRSESLKQLPVVSKTATTDSYSGNLLNKTNWSQGAESENQFSCDSYRKWKMDYWK